MQMEKLLENVREDLRNKDGFSKPSNVCGYLTTHIVDGSRKYLHCHMVCHHFLIWETPMQEDCSEGMETRGRT